MIRLCLDEKFMSADQTWMKTNANLLAMLSAFNEKDS